MIDAIIYFKGDCNYGKDGNVITVPLYLAYKVKYNYNESVLDLGKHLPAAIELNAFD